MRSILAMHKGKLSDAHGYVESAYRLLGGLLSNLMGESYSRAYSRIVHVQELAELQEIFQLKRLSLEGKRSEVARHRGRVRRLWRQRLQGVQQNVDVLLPILAVRSTVIEPHEDIDTWLNFAKVCRKQGRLQLSLKALVNLGVGGD